MVGSAIFDHQTASVKRTKENRKRSLRGLLRRPGSNDCRTGWIFLRHTPGARREVRQKGEQQLEWNSWRTRSKS